MLTFIGLPVGVNTTKLLTCFTQYFIFTLIALCSHEYYLYFGFRKNGWLVQVLSRES